MDILFLLIPVSLVLVGVIVAALVWAVRSGQFDDLDSPGWRLLLDDEDEPPRQQPAQGGAPDAAGDDAGE